MVDSESTQKKAEIIYQNCIELKCFDADKDIKISNPTEAYAIQDSFISLKKTRGFGSIGGWKIALTNPKMQQLVGVDRPVEGAIFRPLIYQNNVTLFLDNYCHLGAEAEIALRVNKNIPIENGVFRNKEEIVPFLKDVMVAIEIVDDRYYGANITYEKLVAQNSMNLGCVVGDPVAIDLMSIDSLQGELILSGKRFGVGSGKNVLEHPLNSVLYLANNLMKRGRSLNAGDIILTGSIATTCWPLNGDKVEAHIDNLKDVSFTVESNDNL